MSRCRWYWICGADILGIQVVSYTWISSLVHSWLVAFFSKEQVEGSVSCSKARLWKCAAADLRLWASDPFGVLVSRPAVAGGVGSGDAWRRKWKQTDRIQTAVQPSAEPKHKLTFPQKWTLESCCKVCEAGNTSRTMDSDFLGRNFCSSHSSFLTYLYSLNLTRNSLFL